MPELDFFRSQLARSGGRSLSERIKDRGLLTVVFLALFALFLVGLAIESAVLLVGYIAAVAFGAYVIGRFKGTGERLQNMVQADRGYTFLLVFLLAISYPIIFSGDAYLIHIATLACIYVIMALGLNITLGFAGLLDVGFAVYFAAGAYTSAQLAVLFDVPFWIGLPLGGLVAAFFGFLIAWPALRVQGHYLAMVTLGYGLIMNILHRNLKFLTNGTDGVLNIPPPSIAGFDFLQPISIFGFQLPFQANFYYLSLALIIVTIFVSYRLQNSNIGRCWEAMREDDIAGKCFGINLTRMKLMAFSTGAFFGGIGGAVFAHMIGFVHPDNFMLLTSITILAMVLIGGMGNIWGVVIGAVLLILIPERLREFENLRMLLFGASMALIMIYRPQGLFPSARKRRGVDQKKMEQLIENSGKSGAHARPVA
ncbi:MAG: branched-chain amino acid ABC transporter permease [Hyphomicrobiaceae bacterium]|nr:branched-chain amino acid ABC transporter permease [Hyphomicrobiaceae bacterium]